VTPAKTVSPARPVKFLKISPDPSLDPTCAARERRGPESPRARREYVKSSLYEMLGMDLCRADLIIDSSYACDMGCRYCGQRSTRGRHILWPQLHVSVKALALAGLRRATLTGGEPGIDPEAPGILADLSSLRIKTVVLTNGLWAADGRKLERFVSAGAAGFLVSLKAFEEKGFEQITGRRVQTAVWRRALLHFSRMKSEKKIRYLGVNHVLTTLTLEGLSDSSWLGDLPSRPEVILSLVEPYSQAMVRLTPPPRVLRPALATIFDRFDRWGLDYTVEGAPLCLLGERWRKSKDPARLHDDRPRIFIRPGAHTDYLMAYTGYQRLLQFTRMPACEACAKYDDCLGVHKRTQHLYDEGALIPFQA
jgi:pyruvate-formate lyase-activating enzyme